MTNQQQDAYNSTVSAKEKRRQRKELEAHRREYADRLQAEEDDGGKASVSHMVLPDYRSGRNERDIHVRQVGLSLDSGRALLEDGELRLAHRRRYGLVGKVRRAADVQGNCRKRIIFISSKAFTSLI